MKNKQLIQKNLSYYRRFYLLIAIATIVMVAVITGSMMVGDSVRMTLVKRVTDRLGDTESVIFNSSGYMDATLVDALANEAWGAIMTDGFVRIDSHLIPVNVWGVDYLRNGTVVADGDAFINTQLAKDSGIGADDDVVLRLAKNGLIPSGSLFVTQNYTTSMRLSCAGVVAASEGGNLSLRNEQTIPLNIFVNRAMLNDLLETGDKVNVILSARRVGIEELNQAWNVEMAGMKFIKKKNCTEITTDRVFMQDALIDHLCDNNQNPNRLYSYLANSIRLGEQSVPYSFVTAMDSYEGRMLSADEILLSDYTARRIGAKVGELVSVSYFKMKGLKRLETDSIQLRVSAIIPMQDWVKDGTLSADFPGLTDVERCTEWDSDLPINLDLITDEDEQYWTNYRSTPKAIVPYKSVINDWKTVFGSATAIRVDNDEVDFSGIDAQMCGVQMVHPREAGLYGAMNGVDFAGLFLALGFFIIVAALLLMVSPLMEMYEHRKGEFQLLSSLGYTHHHVISLLWREALPVVLVSVLAGVMAGVTYTCVIMFLLGNVWQGATQTAGFSVSLEWLTVVGGAFISLLIALGLLRACIVKAISKDNHIVVAKTLYGKTSNYKVMAVGVSVLLLLLLSLNLLVYRSVVLFVIIGCVWILLCLAWGYVLIIHKGTSVKPAQKSQLVWSTLYANRKQVVLSFLTLSIGVFLVFAVGLNRRSFADSSGLSHATGGYGLWMESAVPVYYDLNSKEGRKQLSLTDMPDKVSFMQLLRYSADDASCLNLNKVATPTILGVDMDEFALTSFQVKDNIYDFDNQIEVLSSLQKKSGDAYPVLVDETVLTWGLMLSLGDTLHYQDARGQDVKVLLAGTLPNTIFQGSVLMDRGLFATIWPEITGSEVALVRVDGDNSKQVSQLLATALNEYGVRLFTTNDLLKQFNQVTDTYLTIFLTLGGIGLLLGLMAFVIIIRKNLTAHADDIKLYRMLGFQHEEIHRLLFSENIIVPLYAIFSGVAGALLSIVTGFGNVPWTVWLITLMFMFLFVGCVWLFVWYIVDKEIHVE